MAKDELAEFALKIEATPGTAETLASADVPVRLRRGFVANPETERIDLEEVSDVSSSPPDVSGKNMIGFTVAYNLRGPGDLITVPAVNTLFTSALFTGAAAKTIAIGAVTSGPYVAGEVITGGTSNGTGMVLQETANGAASIPYIPLTGALVTTEVITGGTSGATATSSAGPVDGGYAWRPTDTDFDVSGNYVTARMLRDGQYWEGRGCLSDLEIALTNGGPGVVTQNFSGAWNAHGDVALFGATYPEATITPPRFLSAALKIGSYSPTGIQDVTIRWPTGVTTVDDAQSVDGIVTSDYDRRAEKPTITLEVDQVAVSTFDFFGDMRAGTTRLFECTLGSTAGSRWTFSAPGAQIVSGFGRRDPNRGTFPLTLNLTGTNNEELLIWQH